ncbi:hypothetical protein BKA70DRAFT_1258687 [Coprinopsis sp. MPI-PUGE-AT-0042]|nr:hypothetical protein BKA70DRAFT_1258687 [Coprinopsis sp. MPI-PUGE-AT-0042]
MAYYARSESPPPRQPSPEPVHTPLPSPHLRARDRLRSGTSSRSPLVPPGLAPPPRTLTQSKSCSHLSPEAEAARRSEQALRLAEPQTLRRRVRSNLEANPGAVHFDSASSSQTSSTASPTGSVRRTQRRLPSTNLPSTPTASPSRPVPPVPPMPDSVNHSPTLKGSKDSSSFDIAPIFLPDLHQLSPVSERSSLSPEKKPSKRPSVISLKGMGSRGGGSPSPTERTHHRNIGVTCLKFFSLKSASRVGRSQAATHAQ